MVKNWYSSMANSAQVSCAIKDNDRWHTSISNGGEIADIGGKIGNPAR